jgi:acyl carrier protein
MNRGEIQQRVFDTLGVILVDKSQILENSTFEELALDEKDVMELFGRLESQFKFTFPEAIRERATHAPEHLTLPILVDLIVLMSED